MAATLFSIPKYVPDPSSVEVVAGYEVQSCAPVSGMAMFTGIWAAVTGSPFASNSNILDPAGTTTAQYRARPVRQVTINGTTYTLDTPWSRPFFYDTPVYDAQLTAILLPTLRFTYLGDTGINQTNGTTLMETTGPGQSLWTPDGKTTRFQLQYISNDDPIHVMDTLFRLIKVPKGGSQVGMVADQDYQVDVRNGVVQFQTAPAPTDYLRFEFRKCDFFNDDLLLGLKSAVGDLGNFGLAGYSLHKENNLYSLNQPLANPDLGEILCKIAVRNLREGLTEAALRSTMAWRDGGVSVDPVSNRSLQYVVQKLEVSDTHIQKQVNAYNRSNTRPLVRGDFDMQFDMTQMSPVSISMFQQFSAYSGYGGAGVGGFYMPFWL